MREDCESGVSPRRLDALTSRGFVVGLSLLLLNDFALKAQFHNPLTGKLSDFAGLFVFPLFWSALFPRRRRHVYLLTAAAFVFWKSPYSQPLIDAWNALTILPVGRAADASDLWALLVLPLSYFYFGRRGARTSLRPVPYLVGLVSLFAFAATSYHNAVTYDKKYTFQMSRTELTRRLYNLTRLDKAYRVEPCGYASVTPDKLKVTIPSDFCFNQVDATIGIGAEERPAVVTLRQMDHDCPEDRDDKEKLLAAFEKGFVERLGQASPDFFADELPEDPPAAVAGQPRQLYLVPLGELSGADVKELADYARRRLGAKVQVLGGLPLTDAARDPRFPNSRPQGERLVEYMSATYQKLAAKPGVLMIGVAQEFYVQGAAEPYPAYYAEGGRLAVISLDGLNPKTFCEPPDEGLLNSRLRKLLTKLYSEGL